MGALEGRVIVLTGAGRGIGAEHARLLASEGALLVVNDLGGGTDGRGADAGPAAQLVAEIESAGGRAVANADDVADPDGAQRMIDLALETFGDLHGLVNNAGILRDRTLTGMSEDDWDTSLRVNARGTFLPAPAAARYWREQAKAGREVRAAIVNTSSESGVFANAGQTNYAAAKAGVAAMTEVWHKELFRYGVRVNAICPRARTRLTEALMGGGGPAAGEFDEWDPANISPFVAYLLTESCPIAGEVFVVGGSLVQRVAPWRLDDRWKLEAGGRWDIAALAATVDELGPPTDPDRDTGAVSSRPLR